MQNTSVFDLSYTDSVGSPFEISPRSGSIPVGQSAILTVELTDCARTTTTTGEITFRADDGTTTNSFVDTTSIQVNVVIPDLILAFPHGNLDTGTRVSLDRITGMTTVTDEAQCASTHMHSDSGGIMIDGQGPYGDTNPAACGHGTVEGIPAGIGN